MAGNLDATVITIRGASYEVKLPNELELFAMASFVRALTDATVTPEMWYGTAALMQSICPALVNDSNKLVELDRFQKCGRINLTGEEMNTVYSALYDMWKANSPSLDQTVSITTKSASVSIDTDIVEEMKKRIAQLEKDNTALTQEASN